MHGSERPIDGTRLMNAAEELGCSAVLHRSPSAGYVLVHVLSGTIREAGMGTYRSGQPGSSRPSPTTSPPKMPALSNGRARRPDQERDKLSGTQGSMNGAGVAACPSSA